MTIDDIVTELKTNAKLSVRQEALQPIRQIQQYLITNKFYELVNNIRVWAESNSDSDSQFLRFLAHLTLIIRWARIQHDELSASLIIQKYIEVLLNLRITFLLYLLCFLRENLFKTRMSY